MNKHVNNFIMDVCNQIKYKRIHGDISDELSNHITELVMENVKKGMTQEEAERNAIGQMGDPVDIGKNLNNTHRPKTEWSILALVGVAVLFGIIAIAFFANDPSTHITLGGFLRSYLMYSIVGICIGVFCYYMDYTKLEKYSLHIFAFIFIAMAINQWAYGVIEDVLNLPIGRLGRNLAFLFMPLSIISFSGLAKRWATGKRRDMLKLFAMGAIIVLFYLTQPSIASAMLFIIGFLVVITSAILDKGFKGKRKCFLLSIYGGMIGIGLLYLINMPSYHLSRLKIFIDPGLDPEGSGYVNVVLGDVLSKAKFLGRGDGLHFNHEGIDAIAIPGADSEFVFSYIVSTFGWAAGILLIGVMVLIISRIFISIRHIHTPYGRYLVNAIATVFSLQVMSNILMNLGVFPLMGLVLPFVSYGGMGFIVNMALIGLLLGVYRRKDIMVSSSSVAAL